MRSGERYGGMTAALLCALAVGPVQAQEAEGGLGGGVDQLLGVFGLSLQLLVLLGLGLLLLHCLCLYAGTRMAGLQASFGRAVLTLLLTVLLAIPLALFLGFMGVGGGQRGNALLTQLVGATAEVAAIMILYRSGFGRAVFGYLSAAVLSLVASGAVLLVVF